MGDQRNASSHNGSSKKSDSPVPRRKSAKPPPAVASEHAAGEASGRRRQSVRTRLQRVEGRLLALAAAAGEMTWMATAEGIVAEFLPTWSAFTGQSAEDARGMGWIAALHPDDRASALARWEQALATGTPYINESRIRDARGVYHAFSVRAGPVVEPDGRMREWVGVCHEITARVEAERAQAELLERERVAREELARRAAELEATLEAVGDGLFVHDRLGRVLWLNPMARALLAVDSAPEYAQLSPREQAERLNLRDDEWRPLPPERWPLSRVLRGEVLSGAHATDIVLRALDGRDVYVNISAAPIRGPDGQITGAVTVVRDVSARRQLERRTRESLDALLQLAEALVSGAEITEPAEIAEREPVVESVSTPPAGEPAASAPIERRLVRLVCRLLNCQRVAIVLLDAGSGTIREVALVGEPEEYERALAALVRGAPIDGLIGKEMAARLRQGDVLAVDLAQLPFQGITYTARAALVAPLLLGEQWIGVLGLDRVAAPGEAAGELPDDDVAARQAEDERALIRATARMVAMVLERERLLTERESARVNTLALREANRRMDDFLSLASHELKTPIVSADLNVQTVLRRLRALRAEPAPRMAAQATALDDLVTRTHHQMRRLSRLVEDLLDATRARKGEIKLNPVSCALAPIVRAAVEEERAVYPTREIRLEMLADESVLIRGDADRIEQVIINYLNNAVRYSPADRPITVRCECQGSAIRVAVRDEGQGIAPEEQERIWRRFERAEGVTQQTSGAGVGLGLGLYISRAIIEGHGGRLGLESAPGKGSTFWFTLPT